MGTNTGNGTNSGTGGAHYQPRTGGGGFEVGSGGAPGGTGGTGGFCLHLPCVDPVSANGPDGTSYRGRGDPDTKLWDGAGSVGTDQAVAELVFSGSEVAYTDAGCDNLDPNAPNWITIYLCISSADSSVDSAGTLRVHHEPRPDANCSGPRDGTGPWGMDFTLTADGQLSATLFPASSDTDTGAAAKVTSLNGQIESYFDLGLDGETQPISITAGNGGTYTFPIYSRRNSCGDAL